MVDLQAGLQVSPQCCRQGSQQMSPLLDRAVNLRQSLLCNPLPNLLCSLQCNQRLSHLHNPQRSHRDNLLRSLRFVHLVSRHHNPAVSLQGTLPSSLALNHQRVLQLCLLHSLLDSRLRNQLPNRRHCLPHYQLESLVHCLLVNQVCRLLANPRAFLPPSLHLSRQGDLQDSRQVSRVCNLQASPVENHPASLRRSQQGSRQVSRQDSRRVNQQDSPHRSLLGNQPDSRRASLQGSQLVNQLSSPLVNQREDLLHSRAVSLRAPPDSLLVGLLANLVNSLLADQQGNRQASQAFNPQGIPQDCQRLNPRQSLLVSLPVSLPGNRHLNRLVSRRDNLRFSRAGNLLDSQQHNPRVSHLFSRPLSQRQFLPRSRRHHRHHILQQAFRRVHRPHSRLQRTPQPYLVRPTVRLHNLLPCHHIICRTITPQQVIFECLHN